MQQFNSQRGLTLIELMISLLLSALILAGTVTLFQQSKTNSIQDEQIARMQESGRFALRMLSREISMHGFFGGELNPDGVDKSDAEADLGTDCTADWPIMSLDDPVTIDNDAATKALDTCIADSDILTGTDVLMVKRVADQAALVYRGDGTAATGALKPATMYFKTNKNGGTLYFNDSGTVDTTGTSVNTRFDFFEYLPQVFYIRPWSVCQGAGTCDCVNDGTPDESDCDGDGANDAADTIPTLVRERLAGASMTAQALVEGIENLQIEFGVDSDGDTIADYYEPDPDASELQDSVSARIYVLVRSIDPITGYDNTKDYRLGSTTIANASLPAPPAACRNAGPPIVDSCDYYRRVYTTTVKIRNASRFINSEI